MSYKIIKNIFWLLIERGGQIVAAILISAILARQLGVEGYGLFQYAISVVLMLASFSLVCGSEVIVPRLVYANKHQELQIIGNTFTLRIIASCVSYIVMLVFSFISQNDYKQFLLIAILGLTVFFKEPFKVVVAWLQAKTYNKPAALLGFYAVILKLIIVYIFNLLKVDNLMLYASLWVFESLFVAVGLVIIYRNSCSNGFVVFDMNEMLSLLRAGLPFWFSLIAMYAFLRMDRLFLKEFSTLTELGLYSAVMQIADNFTQLAPIIATSAAPLLIYRESDFNRLRQNIMKLSVLMFGIGITGAVVGWLLAPWIIGILFGPEFSVASEMLGYALFVTSLVFVESALNTFLLKNSNGKSAVIKWILAAIVCLIVDSLVVPEWGGYGALMGLLSGYVVAVSFGIYWIMNKNVGMII